MIFAQTDATRRVIGKNPADTSNVTIVAAVPEGQRVTLESVLVAADATGESISLWYNDGSNDYYLMNAVAVSAHNSVALQDHHIVLRDGWSLKCKASVGGHLSVTTVVMEAKSNKGSNSQK